MLVKNVNNINKVEMHIVKQAKFDQIGNFFCCFLIKIEKTSICENWKVLRDLDEFFRIKKHFALSNYIANEE